MKDIKVYTPKPETLLSLAKLYEMDKRTLKRNIEKIMWKLSFEKENRRVLSVREVELIVEHLGEPPMND